MTEVRRELGMSVVLRFLAPYMAVGLGWLWLSNGWFAVIAHHFQILMWEGFRIRLPGRPAQLRYLLLTLPAAAAGPVLFTGSRYESEAWSLTPCLRGIMSWSWFA